MDNVAYERKQKFPQCKDMHLATRQSDCYYLSSRLFCLLVRESWRDGLIHGVIRRVSSTQFLTPKATLCFPPFVLVSALAYLRLKSYTLSTNCTRYGRRCFICPLGSDHPWNSCRFLNVIAIATSHSISFTCISETAEVVKYRAAELVPC